MKHENPELPHIVVETKGKRVNFTTPPSGGGSNDEPPVKLPQLHGNKVLRSYQATLKLAEERDAKRQARGLPEELGVVIEFKTDPNYPLPWSSFEDTRSGVEILSIRECEDVTYVNVFLPSKSRSHFVKKIEKYLEEVGEGSKPANKKLLESIDSVKLAVLQSFWLDETRDFPEHGQKIWWEVWLRANPDRELILKQFTDLAESSDLEIKESRIEFVDRTVLLVFGDSTQLSDSAELLDGVAELHSAKHLQLEYMELSKTDQKAWVDDLLNRLTVSGSSAPAVCILDGGVNRGHDLLKDSLSVNDMHTYNGAWGVHDHRPDGHGTGMAGVALFGNLHSALGSADPVTLRHRLESLKIQPLNSRHDEPELYGAIVDEGVRKVENSSKRISRSICMAVTSTDNKHRGKPSSWSAKIDSLIAAMGSSDEQEKKRLFLISVGNTQLANYSNYRDTNDVSGVFDPAQSWNAIGVGAFTNLIDLPQEDFDAGFQPVAKSGDLCPFSTTSLTWQKQWPIKPEVVFEGGNMMHNGHDFDVGPCILTTHSQPMAHGFFTWFNGTSAATAEAARQTAILQAEYADLWPETIRALFVHSARWTPRMIEYYKPLASKKNLRRLLRSCGYGVPDLDRAMWSMENRLTLIMEDRLTPFKKEKGSGYKTNQMNLHKLPWPQKTLEDLGETKVRLRVALSYYIEPNPGERGRGSRHLYASHRLAFDVKSPIETSEDFSKRVNRAARQKGEKSKGNSHSDNWLLGVKLRNSGSLSVDEWVGTAAELAYANEIAVFPSNGWWRTCHKFNRWDGNVRYALVASIETEAVSTDIKLYTEVKNMIATPVQVSN